MQLESILIHDKPTSAEAKVTKADKVLIVFGGPKDCYHSKNQSEYWAEGFQTWYDTNRTMDHDHDHNHIHIHTREQLRAYDPHLAELLEDVLGDPEWRFISPRLRAGNGHLAGYDPANAPVVTDPEHIDAAGQDYHDKMWSSYWKRLSDKHGLPAATPSEAESRKRKAGEHRSVHDARSRRVCHGMRLFLASSSGRGNVSSDFADRQGACRTLLRTPDLAELE